MHCFFLEKTRPMRTSALPLSESNFHIFYCLLQLFPDSFLKKLGLIGPKGVRMTVGDFEILKTEGNALPLNEDEHGYSRLSKFLKNLSFKEEESLTIFKILANILLLSKSPQDNLKVLCSNWEIDESDILFFSNLTQKQLIFLCNEMYSQLFKSLIRKLNESLSKDIRGNELTNLAELNSQFQQYMASNSHPKFLSINFFDSLGFETFRENAERFGLYQLLTNYVNEKLQQVFLEMEFKSEEVEFLQEGLLAGCPRYEFQDNLAVIELFERKSNESLDSCFLEVQERINREEKMEEIKKVFFSKLEKIIYADKSDVVFMNKEVGSFVIFHTFREVEYRLGDFCEGPLKDDSLYQKFEENILISSKNSLFSHFLSKNYARKIVDPSLEYFNEKFVLINKMIANYDKHYVMCLSPALKKRKRGLILLLCLNNLKLSIVRN